MKTISLKKVSAVAVAALAFGGLTSVAPANAGAAAWTCSSAYVTDPCTQIVGGIATLAFNADAASVYVVEVTGASITNASDSAGTHEPVGGAADATVTYPTSSVQFTPNAIDDDLTIYLTSSAAGTATVKATKLSSGVPITTTSTTVTWIASGTNAISATNSQIFTVTDGNCSAASTPGAARAVALGANALATDYYIGAAADAAVGELTDICVYTFDGNGAALTPASITVFADKGFVSATSDADPSASSVSVTVASNVAKSSYEGDGIQKGAAKINAIITDSLGNSISLSTNFTWFGKLYSVVLSNNYAANNYAAAAADTSIGATSGMIAVTALDSNKNVIPFSTAANNWLGATTNFLAAAGTNSSAALLVSSAKGNGSTATLRGETNAYATVVVDGNDDDTANTAAYNGRINITCADAKYEKLSITLYGYDATLATNTIKSNTVDFYCSGAVDKVTVTPAATSIAAGTTTTVNVSAVDANGYPVADGTSVSMVASNGSTVAPETKTTAGGKFTTAATLVTTTNASSTVVTAIIGSKSGSASVALTGGNSDVATMIDSLNAKITALNALIAKIMKKLGVK